MDCLSTTCFRAFLPNFMQSLFTYSDDSSYWGREEDLDSAIDQFNATCADTEAMTYKRESMSPDFASSEFKQKPSDSGSITYPAGQISGEFMTPYIVIWYRLLTLWQLPETGSQAIAQLVASWCFPLYLPVSSLLEGEYYIESRQKLWPDAPKAQNED